MSAGTRRLVRLHLLERPGQQRGKIVPVGNGEIETGDWVATESSANAAVGAELHLHEYQKEKSWRSGVITGWRWHESENGRVVYRVKIDESLQRFQRDGWPSRGERLMVWSDGFADD